MPLSREEVWNAVSEADINPVPPFLVEGSFDHQGQTCTWFDEEMALAALLMDERVFVSMRPASNGGVALAVLCSDTFAYSCADAEGLPHKQIPTLWRMWRADDITGPEVWCVLARRRQPIEPVLKKMTDQGWDMDSLDLQAEDLTPWLHAQLDRFGQSTEDVCAPLRVPAPGTEGDSA